MIEPAAASQVTSHDNFDSFLTIHVYAWLGGVLSFMYVLAWFFISCHSPFDLAYMFYYKEGLRSVLSRKLVDQELLVSLGMPCFPKRPCAKAAWVAHKDIMWQKTIPRQTFELYSFLIRFVEASFNLRRKSKTRWFKRCPLFV